MPEKVWELVVYENPDNRLVIRALFTKREDAVITYNTTYSKVEPKPRYTLEPRELNDRSTHL